MAQESTILIDKKIIELLKEAKDHPKQTYNELLEKMARIFITLKKRNQYDEFLHKIQHPKMKGVVVTKKEGLPRDSIIKLNYIFTISEKMIKKFLLNLSEEKKRLIKNELIKKIN